MSASDFSGVYIDEALRRQIERATAQMREAVAASLGPQLAPMAERMQQALKTYDTPHVRELADSLSRVLNAAASPALTDSVRRINELVSAAYAPQFEALGERFRSFDNLASLEAPRGVVESIAESASIDVAVPDALFTSLAADLEASVSSDEEVAGLRAEPIAKLDADQRAALGRFIVRWGANFGVDLAIGSHVFGDTFVGDVLEWAAILAVVQVVIYMVVLKPDAPQDEGPPGE